MIERDHAVSVFDPPSRSSCQAVGDGVREAALAVVVRGRHELDVFDDRHGAARRRADHRDRPLPDPTVRRALAVVARQGRERDRIRAGVLVDVGDRVVARDHRIVDLGDRERRRRGRRLRSAEPAVVPLSVTYVKLAAPLTQRHQ